MSGPTPGNTDQGPSAADSGALISDRRQGAARTVSPVVDHHSERAAPVTPGNQERAGEAGDKSAHRHRWSDWYRPVFYRDSLGQLLVRGVAVSLGRLGGTDEPVTTGWVRACIDCDTEDFR